MNKEIINTGEAPAPIGPYSQAVWAGNLLFCSGQIAINPKDGSLDTANIETETKRVMENIGAILRAAGLDFGAVVKTTIFLKDMNDFAAVNAVYGSYFKDAFPARETVQVSVLPKNVNVEISVTALR
ncbi:MAG: Enamine/imine deaminase [Bacteroidota bacterium]|jgi:2-iminobutanoate/2-iminopropanoate deaminase